jgi:hypothetical protein
MRFCAILQVDRRDVYAVLDHKAGRVRSRRVLEAIVRAFPSALGVTVRGARKARKTKTAAPL